MCFSRARETVQIIQNTNDYITFQTPVTKTKPPPLQSSGVFFFSPPRQQKGNLLSVFTTWEWVALLFYMMSTLIHGARSVPAFTRVNFPQEREKRQQCGETESEWAMKNGKEKTETVGVRHGLPPFPPLTLFPLFVSACLGVPSLSLSLASRQHKVMQLYRASLQ